MKKWLKIAFWGVFLIGVIVLLVMVADKQSEALMNPPKIHISAEGENAFLNEAQVMEKLKFHGLWQDEGIRKQDLNVEGIEKMLSEISQIKSSKVYTHIGTDWEIDIVFRKPIARIFNRFNESFYLDEDGETVGTINSHTARVLVVTGEIPDRKNSPPVYEIINNDSLKSIHKLDEIYRISDYVCNDPVLHSLIGQMHLKKNGDFVLIPLVGDFKIVFGSAGSEEVVKEKFKKLIVFYEEAIPNVGWNTYEEISLKYDGQIVCKNKVNAN